MWGLNNDQSRLRNDEEGSNFLIQQKKKFPLISSSFFISEQKYVQKKSLPYHWKKEKKCNEIQIPLLCTKSNWIPSK